MYKIIISDQCGCYRKSNLQDNLEFNSKDDARKKAIEIQDFMNDFFCKKHMFEAQELSNNFVIKFLREEIQPDCCGSGCCN